MMDSNVFITREGDQTEARSQAQEHKRRCLQSELANQQLQIELLRWLRANRWAILPRWRILC